MIIGPALVGYVLNICILHNFNLLRTHLHASFSHEDFAGFQIYKYFSMFPLWPVHSNSVRTPQKRSRTGDSNVIRQDAQLLQRGCTMLLVTEYFAKPLEVTQGH